MARNKAAREAEEQRRMNAELGINEEVPQQTGGGSATEAVQGSATTPNNNPEVVIPSAKAAKSTLGRKRKAPGDEAAPTTPRKRHAGVAATGSPLAEDDGTPSGEEEGQDDDEDDQDFGVEVGVGHDTPPSPDKTRKGSGKTKQKGGKRATGEKEA